MQHWSTGSKTSFTIPNREFARVEGLQTRE